MTNHSLTNYERAQRATLECLLQSGFPGAVNHLLGDPRSTNRVRQILCYLSETTLQTNGERLRQAMGDDEIAGLGWILQSCSEALGLIEELERQERAANAANVSQLNYSA